MSLINVRNFLAPLRNKYQMGALLVLALIVAVVRVIGSSEPPANRENLKLNDEIKGFLASQQPATQVQKGNTGSLPSLADPFSEGLLPDGWKDEASNDAPAPAPSKNDRGLSDVKRSLGLE